MKLKSSCIRNNKINSWRRRSKKAEEASNALFGGQGSLDNMPTATVASNISILDAIIQVGFAPSKGQARQLITQGGISLMIQKYLIQTMYFQIQILKMDLQF